MAFQALALYDFQSENVGEISVQEDKVLTMYCEHDIKGWLEGANSRSQRDLFPASYVQILRAGSGGNAVPGVGAGATEPSASRYANVPTAGYDSPAPPQPPSGFPLSACPAASTFCPPPLTQTGGSGLRGLVLARLQHGSRWPE
uniref:sorting nexin-18-like n=1 Tax=Pristiophorus japonicus TaxID=55135 RepID=UPI00398E9640